MSRKSDVLVVIPARMGSTRFPGKVLALLAGKPVVQWCWQAALKAEVGPVVVATQDEAVRSWLEPLGATVVMTSRDCPSGTDRVFEAAKAYSKKSRRNFSCIINLQGDEPLIHADTIQAVAKALVKSKWADISTAVVPLRDEAQLGDPNVVKAARGDDGRCLYFSRAAIASGSGAHWRHIGIYGYRAAALKRFVALPPSNLEKSERLEQLRALQAGMSIVAAVVEDSSIAIDTRQDLERAKNSIQGVAIHG